MTILFELPSQRCFNSFLVKIFVEKESICKNRCLFHGWKTASFLYAAWNFAFHKF